MAGREVLLAPPPTVPLVAQALMEVMRASAAREAKAAMAWAAGPMSSAARSVWWLQPVPAARRLEAPAVPAAALTVAARRARVEVVGTEAAGAPAAGAAVVPTSPPAGMLLLWEQV